MGLPDNTTLQVINSVLSTLVAAFVIWLGSQTHQLSIQLATLNATTATFTTQNTEHKREFLELRTRLTQLEIDLATIRAQQAQR